MTQDTPKDAAQTGSAARVKEQIDRNLRRVYDDVLKEEVPDRFKDLLARLREKDGQKDDAGGKTP